MFCPNICRLRLFWCSTAQALVFLRLTCTSPRIVSFVGNLSPRGVDREPVYTVTVYQVKSVSFGEEISSSYYHDDWHCINSHFLHFLGPVNISFWWNRISRFLNLAFGAMFGGVLTSAFNWGAISDSTSSIASGLCWLSHLVLSRHCQTREKSHVSKCSYRTPTNSRACPTFKQNLSLKAVLIRCQKEERSAASKEAMASILNFS